jgi:hypothetical protein
MAGFTTANNEHLIRSNIWSRQIKELLLDELNAMKYVRVLTEFPDGTTINIPSIGEAETFDFAEGQAIKYNRLDTGNFTFTFTQYKGSAHAISEKFKHDSFYYQDVVNAFVPRQHRALMEAVETRILAVGPDGQTASNLNTINGGDHRWVGQGTSNTIAVKDFARARFSLKKAQVPLNNLVAIVDPSVAYTLETQANLVNALSPMKMWEDVVKTGATTGTSFRFNLMGFDIYESNYLKSGISETVDSVAVTNGVANILFSATAGDTLPFIGGFRQMPTVYSEFNKDLQQQEFVTVAYYDFGLYRPENLITILTDATAIN